MKKLMLIALAAFAAAITGCKSIEVDRKAQSLATVQNADKVLFLEDGRIAQYGTYAELSEQPGPFRDMAEKQRLERQLQAEE